MIETKILYNVRVYDSLPIGERAYTVYEIGPSKDNVASTEDLVLALQNVILEDAIALLMASLSEYYGRADFDSNWFKILGAQDVLEAHRLADSLNEAIVFEASSPIVELLPVTLRSCRFVICHKRTGALIQRLLSTERSVIRYASSLQLVPLAAFQRFSELWTPRSPSDIRTEAEKNPQRFMYISEVGENLGTMHARGTLHGDVHSGNFLPVPLDPAQSRFPLLPPTSHQCATDIATFLPELKGAEWLWFRAGYISARGAEGRMVIALIETGQDAAAAILANSDPQRALPLLLAQLKDLNPNDSDAIFATYCNLGLCHSRLKHHGEAVAAYEVAESHLRGLDDLSSAIAFRWNFGVALHRMKDYPRAAVQFEFIRANREVDNVSTGIYERALHHLFDCYEKMDARPNACAVAEEILALSEKPSG